MKLILFLIILSTAAVYGQQDKSNSNSTSNIVELECFQLKKTEDFLHIPDSLRGSFVSGYAVVQVKIDSNLKPELEKILKFHLEGSDSSLIDFIDSPFDSNIQKIIKSTPYWRVFNYYLRNSVYFIKICKGKTDGKAYKTFLIRMK